MSYIDGFVAAVPLANKEAYREHATDALPYFKKLGVTRMVENWGDDVPEGKVTDFKRSVKAKPDEAIIFSWLEYPDKATRDKANASMMNDPQMKDMGKSMPFDGQRMIFGGFEPINDSGVSVKPGYVDGSANSRAGRRTRRRIARWPTNMRRSSRNTEPLVRSMPGATTCPDGKVTDYKGAVQATNDENVVYSWVEWPSKEARDQGWEKAMADPRMKDMKMPFDGQRVIFGGFQTILDA